MKDINNLIAQPIIQNSSAPKKLERIDTSTLSDIQSKTVNYFFKQIKATYGDRAKTCFANKDEEKFNKAKFASVLANISAEHINSFFLQKDQEQLEKGAQWPDLHNLVGEITGIRRNSDEAVKSWTYFLNRRMGDDWLDALTFETAKRIGCGCNELIANLSNNNTEKAKNAYIEKYNALLTEIDNGFKLPELRLVLEHKTGSNKNRTAEDKERITKTDGYAAFQKLIKGNK